MAPPTQKQIREPPQIYQNVILGNWVKLSNFKGFCTLEPTVPSIILNGSEFVALQRTNPGTNTEIQQKMQPKHGTSCFPDECFTCLWALLEFYKELEKPCDYQYQNPFTELVVFVSFWTTTTPRPVPDQLLWLSVLSLLPILHHMIRPQSLMLENNIHRWGCWVEKIIAEFRGAKKKRQQKITNASFRVS